ncbi:MAG: shikimate dehydrogenase [Methylococcaceae bacterium]|jgi:shikimate dehydrogenase
MITPDRYAVFGQPINHSKSPRIHQLFAEQTGQLLTYTAQEVSASQFKTAVREFFGNAGKGLNCTVPLKQLAWELADNKTPRAQLSKAVNTLALHSDGSLIGDNTDGIGLVTDLTQHHSLQLNGMRILILGAGGASRGILGPLLEQAPKTIVIANRTLAKAVDLAQEFGQAKVIACGFEDLADQQFELVLNATSASLSNQLPPLPKSLLSPNAVCYDLAYANQATAFVLWGQQQHARKSVDGLGMLVEQAAEAFFIWRGIRPDTKPVLELLNSERTA